MLNLLVGVQDCNPFSFSLLDFLSYKFSCETQFQWSFPLALLSFFSACLDLLDRAQRSIPIAVLSCLLIKYSNSELTESNYFFELGYRAVIKLGTERLATADQCSPVALQLGARLIKPRSAVLCSLQRCITSPPFSARTKCGPGIPLVLECTLRLRLAPGRHFTALTLLQARVPLPPAPL